MKIIFLGTNGWFSTKTGNTICTLVESEKYYVVFDAGDGIQKLDKYVTKRKPIYLFLSHLHLDHVFGLHILPKFKFKNKFVLYCPKELKKDFDKLNNHPFIMPLEVVSPGIEIKELSAKRKDLPFSVEIKKLNHIDLTFGYRIFLDGKIISYCCDTGKSKNVLKLSNGADALIHDCSNRPGLKDAGWGHVNPQEAAQIAKKTGAKKLFLTHFSSVQYTAIKDRLKAQTLARKIFKNTTVAMDEMTVEI